MAENNLRTEVLYQYVSVAFLTLDKLRMRFSSDLCFKGCLYDPAQPGFKEAWDHFGVLK